MRCRIAFAALTAALATSPALAADPPCPKCADAACPAPAAKMIVKVFAVADLVTQIPDFAMPAQPAAPRPVFVQPAPALAPVMAQPVALPLPAGLLLKSQPAPMQLDAVPPGAVRVVRAESPTAVLIGGLKTCEPACPLPNLAECQYRVALGEGIRINVPALGPTPLALCPAPCPVSSSDALVKTITSTVRPASWACAGGAGKVEYFAVGNSLVVCNTPEVVREVDDLLNSLRKVQDRSVVVECRLVSVPVEFFERIGFDFNTVKCESGPAAFPSEPQVVRVLEAVQGDRRASVLMAPKITLFSGQAGCVSIDCETKTFTTGLDVRAVNGQAVTVPKQETVALGTTLQVQPTISADRRHVRLAFAVKQAELKEPVTLMPVTSMITPVFEGGSQGQPIPFTQFIQQPNVARRSAERTVTVPDGGTVLVPVGKRFVEVRSEFGPPVLSHVPYLNRLFKNVGIGKEQHEVIALLTARVVATEEKPCCDSEAARLVTAYQKACAEGRTEEAMKLAMKALAADPTCFAGKK